MKIDELEVENDFLKFDSNFYEIVKATPLKEPKLLSFSKSVCDLIGLDYDECEKKELVWIVIKVQTLILHLFLSFKMLYKVQK